MGDRPAHETATFRVELASLRASTAPLALIAGRLIAPDISESGGLGDKSEFSYFKNERTRAVFHLYGPASMLSPSLFARTRSILNKIVLHLYAWYVVNILRANMR